MFVDNVFEPFFSDCWGQPWISTLGDLFDPIFTVWASGQTSDLNGLTQWDLSFSQGVFMGYVDADAGCAPLPSGSFTWNGSTTKVGEIYIDLGP